MLGRSDIIIKVGLVSLGCPKNQVDSERMMAVIHNAGYDLEQDPAMADVVVINTCGFIQSAKQEAIETILEFCQLKKEGRIKHIIITGCLAERYKQEIVSEFPEADAVVGIGGEIDIAEHIGRVVSGQRLQEFPCKDRLPLEGKRIQSTLPFYAYLKIAEGCSNNCAYCAIPSIRGGLRSRRIEDITEEAESLVKSGVSEIILIAQDTTSYGVDLYGKPMICELLRQLCRLDLRWIRLLYCYPERVTDELIEVMAANKKIAKYIDLPIQHIDEDILRRMNRIGNRESITALITKLRDRIPDIAIRTTLIAGLPGETERQFADLAEFVGQMRFDHLGCFAYSQEEGTKAAEMDGQIESEVKERRAELINDKHAMIVPESLEKYVGKRLTVVVEGFDKYAECYFGRSEYQAPEIDSKIFFSEKNKVNIGNYVDITIEEVLDYDIIGQLTIDN